MKIVQNKVIESSFLSCEKDLDKIIHMLLVDNKPYSNQLKRLLYITNNDCLDPTKYVNEINLLTDNELIKQGYIRKKPRILVDQDLKVYIVISFGEFMPSSENPAFRDCLIHINIFCHPDCWDLNDLSSRPIKIMGYIDGILNGAKLSGIGALDFAGASLLVLNQELMGYVMTYSGTHFQVPSNGDDRSIELLPIND